MEYQKILQDLLYRNDINEQLNILKKTDNPLLLHYYIGNYNWDNGFDIPIVIIENKDCDFGTRLFMFYLADGLRLLQDPNEVANSPLKQWSEFLVKLYNKLKNKDFSTQDISYDPELTKIQIFKIKKANPDMPEYFLMKSPGEEIDVQKV
jgi:Domain of unknown function (DUF4274)